LQTVIVTGGNSVCIGCHNQYHSTYADSSAAYLRQSELKVFVLADFDVKIHIHKNKSLSQGIGKESARVLAMRGAYVIMTSRDPAKGEEAKADNAANGAPEANMKVMQACTYYSVSRND
jgi:hypothetical protein